MRKLFFVFMIMCLFIKNGQAQFFSMGTDADSIKYEEMNGNKINLISPKSFQFSDQFYKYLDSAYYLSSTNYHIKDGKIKALLHTKTLESNGFVAWAPSRTELFTIPSRGVINGYWPQQLCIHEMRHYMQMKSAQKSSSAVYKVLFGEQFSAAMVGLFIPSWYMEGDAVLCETVFTDEGRGRLPSFSAPLFSKLNSMHKIPSYDKWLLGSMNQNYPNEYLFGYWMVNALYRNPYAKALPTKIFEDAVSLSFSFAPFSSSVLKNSNYRLSAFCRHTLLSIKDSVNADLQKRTMTPFTRLIDPKEYANYKVLGKNEQGNIIAYKTSMHGEPCLVEINKTKKEKKILQTGLVADNDISQSQDFITFSTTVQDARRELASKSAMNIFQISSHQYHRRRMEVPSLSIRVKSSQKEYASVQYLVDGRFAIVRSGLADQQAIWSDTLDYSFHPKQVVFGNGDTLLSIIQTPHAIKLVEFRPDHSRNELITSSVATISNPVYYGGRIFIEADFSGNSEIWEYDKKSKKLICLTSTPFGAHSPVILNDTLYYSYTTYQGDIPVFQFPITPIESQTSWNFMFQFANEVSTIWKNNANGKPKTDSVPEATHYYKFSHLFRVHSWGPITTDPVNQSVGLGVQVNSQNRLNTMSSAIYSGYSLNNQTLTSGVKMSYEAWYPKISFNYFTELIKTNEVFQKPIYNFEASVSLPLTFQRKDWYFYIEPKVLMRPKYSMHIQEIIGNDINVIHDRYMNYGITFSGGVQRHTNSRNIYPRMGIYGGIFAFAQEYNGVFGNLTGIKGGVWLPGFFRHDGFRIRSSYEKRSETAFPYSSYSYGVRPYNIIDNPTNVCLNSDYFIPLLYPDLPAMGPILYIKRIIGGISFDKGFNKNNTYESTGLHVGIDLHILRSYIPINVLCSWYYLSNEKKWMFQSGFGLNLYSY